MVDAGPFIHLDQIGHLRLLQRLPRLFVPPSVVQELTETRLNLARWPNVTVRASRGQPDRALEAQRTRPSLHRGELDCLRLALELHPCIFLTDDLAARSVAEKLCIEVHGTVGLIAYGVTRQWLSVSVAEEALKALYHRSSLFITYTIIERAIQRVKEAA